MVNFEFAFSTGNEIDLLRFPGKVIDAFTLEPQVGVLVMLYRELHDLDTHAGKACLRYKNQ